MSDREQGKYWLKDDGVWTVAFWDGHCWEDGTNFGLNDDDYDEIGPPALNPDDIQALKAQCWKDAYLAGMEHGHHWTVEGGYVPGDLDAAEDYVNDRIEDEKS